MPAKIQRSHVRPLPNTARDPRVIAQRFEITISESVPEGALGRASTAPTQPVLAVVRDRDGDRRAVLARFGLAPAWAKLRGGPSLINTRDDKLGSSGACKPLVRSARHRALIVADGYYEWQSRRTQAAQAAVLPPARQRPAVRVRRAVDDRHPE